MKQIFLAILLAVGALGAWANPVSQSRASEAAQLWIKARSGEQRTVKQVYTSPGRYHIINLAPKGWVIVSTDDTVDPIIGYNLEGSLDVTDLPANMHAVINEMGDANAYQARLRSTPSVKWSNMAAEYSRADDDGTIAPLIQVNWTQEGNYAKYCPSNASGRALVGCVAVAMGQAMTVQRWPNKGQGKFHYVPAGYPAQEVNWDEEKPYDWDAIISGTNSNDEAARLLYHAGVSVSMGYGVNGSGIPSNEVNRISDALKNYFCYPSDVTYIWRNSYRGDWNKLIYNELAAGRAVVYNAISHTNTGAKDAGHSFNVDGYNGSGLYHLNWGWNGTGNGYFQLDRLNVKDYEYNYDQVAVIGIGSPERELRSIELTETTIDENLPAGTVVGEVLINGEAPKSNFTVTVQGVYNATSRDVPFNIVNGNLVTTAPIPAGNIGIEISARTTGGDRLTAEFTINVVAYRKVETATSLSYDRNSGDFSLKTKHGVTYTLTSSDGATIATGRLEPLPKLVFNKAQLGNGENTLTLRADDGDTKVLKIKK